MGKRPVEFRRKKSGMNNPQRLRWNDQTLNLALSRPEKRTGEGVNIGLFIKYSYIPCNTT
jgi:hypothetical protein